MGASGYAFAIDVQVRAGIDRWQAITGKLKTIPEELQWIISGLGEQGLEQLKYYPPQQYGMVYRRTYRLYAGWTLDVSKTYFKISNNVSYAPLVQGKEQLAVS